MYRAVLDHPKFSRLMKLLGLPRYAAAGVLEVLWHLAGRFTPQGDIGRYSDDEITSWIGWEGEPTTLINALVTAGWLNRHPTYRLIIHDFHDHADDATKASLRRSNKDFVTRRCADAVPTVSGQSSDAVPTVSPLPEPEPEPEPEPGGGAREKSRPSATPANADVDDENTVVMTFPLRRGTWELTLAKAQEYSTNFPEVDVRNEFRKARQWLLDHPKRRKTSDGMPGFLSRWLDGADEEDEDDSLEFGGFRIGGSGGEDEESGGEVAALGRADDPRPAAERGWESPAEGLLDQYLRQRDQASREKDAAGNAAPTLPEEGSCGLV